MSWGADRAGLWLWLWVQDAGYVAREMGGLMAAAVKQYEASGPGPIAAPGGRAACLAGGAIRGTAGLGETCPSSFCG